MAWQEGWGFLEGVGQSDKFGAADYAKALQEGKSKAQIRDYIASDDVTVGGQMVHDLVKKDSGFTSKLGQSYGAPPSTQQSTHFGGADLLHAQATIRDQGGNPYSGESAIRIDDYSSNAPRSSGYMGTRGYAVQSAAQGQRALNVASADADAAAAWRQTESDKRAKEAEARYNAMIKAQEDAAEAARKEALKVKYTGATHVGSGQSAMGIKFKQSPAFASGSASRGTAQFSRSDKGTKLTNMNIA